MFFARIGMEGKNSSRGPSTCKGGGGDETEEARCIAVRIFCFV